MTCRGGGVTETGLCLAEPPRDTTPKARPSASPMLSVQGKTALPPTGPAGGGRGGRGPENFPPRKVSGGFGTPMSGAPLAGHQSCPFLLPGRSTRTRDRSTPRGPIRTAACVPPEPTGRRQASGASEGRETVQEPRMSVKKCLPRHAGAFLAWRFSRDGSASGYRAAPPVSQAVTAKVKNRVGGVSTAFSSEESQHQRGTLRVEDSALRGGTFRPQHPAHRNHSSVSPPAPSAITSGLKTETGGQAHWSRAIQTAC